MLYLILKNLYRLYNDNLNNPSLNKLSIKKQIIHSQMILKIKKTKLKKGRVKFSFHSLFYGNFLLRQYFEIELVGETKKQEIRDFLNNELNPKKWYYDKTSILLVVIISFLIIYSLEIYLMHFIKMLIIVDSGTSQIFTSYLNNNFKFFSYLSNVIQFFKIL